MTTIAQTRLAMDAAGEHWRVPLMDFVDDFRRHPGLAAVAEPFAHGEPRLDALVAGVVEALCTETQVPVPQWVEDIPPSPRPWFVSGIEGLKAITLAESPLPFRRRKVFVMENFLSRV